MFDSIGWAEILVLAVAGMFIIGPERLPHAAAWLGKATRRAREYVGKAQSQMRSEFGDEIDQIREPLSDLRSLRNLNPRQALTNHLLDGYDPTDDLRSLDIRDELRPHRDRPDATSGQAVAASEVPANAAAGEHRRANAFDSEAT